LKIGERGEDKISERCCESNGVVECGGREIILAGLDWILLVAFQSVVGVDGVELFLSLDCPQIVQEIILLGLVVDLKACLIHGNVVDERSEESDLEDLVECNETLGDQGVSSEWL